MTLTNRFAGFSIRRALVVGVVALGLAAGTVVRLGAAEAHAADLPYSAWNYAAGCNHLWGYDEIDHRRLDVITDLLVSTNQYAVVWVQLTNYWTGQIVKVSGSDWTMSAAGPVLPGGHYLPKLGLPVPDGINVKATVWVNWFDPAANYAYEGNTVYTIGSYESVEWTVWTGRYYAGC
jgi:hypothetical protein